MYIFSSAKDRDSFSANDGDQCRIGPSKYVYSIGLGWREVANVLTFENSSPLERNCSCTHCQCED